MAGLGRRARLDRGLLGIAAITVRSARQAAGLLRAGAAGLGRWTAKEVQIAADVPRSPSASTARR